MFNNVCTYLYSPQTAQPSTICVTFTSSATANGCSLYPRHKSESNNTPKYDMVSTDSNSPFSKVHVSQWEDRMQKRREGERMYIQA